MVALLYVLPYPITKGNHKCTIREKNVFSPKHNVLETEMSDRNHFGWKMHKKDPNHLASALGSPEVCLKTFIAPVQLFFL